MSALETFSSSSWIAPSPLPPSIPIFPMADETRTSANGDGDWLIQPELNGAGNSSWRRQRRQLNIPVNNRPRHAQLYNTKQKYFVQVQHDGRIRTTTQSNSLFSIFEVLLWCSLASSPLHPCMSESNESSVFGVILFHFQQTDRYLCLNANGKLYTAKRTELVDESDCAFQHEIVWQNHDIYYSWKYPYNNDSGDSNHTSNQTLLDRTPLPVNATGSIFTALSDDPTSGLFGDCRPKWFLGVSGTGRPRTFRRSKCVNLRKNVLFIQRWFHRPSGQIAFHNPAVGAGTLSPEAGSVDRSRVRGSARRGRRRPAFQILFGRMVASKTGRGGVRKMMEEKSSREKSATLCHNLLMNCNPQNERKRDTESRRKSEVISSP